MKFRNEVKHEINYNDLLNLRLRLSKVMQPDAHAVDGKYKIRSIYFDTPTDTALMEKLNGINKREKFRIRFYNNDISLIFLEKKSKIDGLCAKESCIISANEARQIADGDISWMKDSERALCRELYFKMKSQLLHPKTIVDYTRIPFVYALGNVRVTIDYDIRTGNFRTDFLNLDTLTLPAGDSHIILEVKWDEYLPDIIKDAVLIKGRHASSFSKYAQCRIYG